jgi:hypothetical protein
MAYTEDDPMREVKEAAAAFKAQFKIVELPTILVNNASFSLKSFSYPIGSRTISDLLRSKDLILIQVERDNTASMADCDEATSRRQQHGAPYRTLLSSVLL